MLLHLMVEKRSPNFYAEVTPVSYEDGCKVYFEDGLFVICRFSGIELLLRIFAEANDSEKAKKYIQAFRELLYLD